MLTYIPTMFSLGNDLTATIDYQVHTLCCGREKDIKVRSKNEDAWKCCDQTDGIRKYSYLNGYSIKGVCLTHTYLRQLAIRLTNLFTVHNTREQDGGTRSLLQKQRSRSWSTWQGFVECLSRQRVSKDRAFTWVAANVEIWAKWTKRSGPHGNRTHNVHIYATSCLHFDDDHCPPYLYLPPVITA